MIETHYDFDKELIALPDENILIRQAAHPLSQCLAELRWGRPAIAQEILDGFIKVCQALENDSPPMVQEKK